MLHVNSTSFPAGPAKSINEFNALDSLKKCRKSLKNRINLLNHFESNINPNFVRINLSDLGIGESIEQMERWIWKTNDRIDYMRDHFGQYGSPWQRHRLSIPLR